MWIFQKLHWFPLTCILLFLLSTTCKSQRLPTHLSPFYYRLHLKLWLDSKPRFTGQLLILVHCKSSTQDIVLHSKNLTISLADTKVFEVNKDYNDIRNISIYSQIAMDYDRYKISVNDRLQNNKTYKIKINFQRNISVEPEGISLQNYMDENKTEKKFLVTLFEHTGARSAFPCFDEPSYKAAFRITLGHDKNLRSLSNMPTIGTTIEKGSINRVEVNYKESSPMPSYMTSFILSDFEKAYTMFAGSDTPLTVNFWATKDRRNELHFAAIWVPKLLESIKTYFHIYYVILKLDIVAVPNLPVLGTEGSGLIFLEESKIFHYDDDNYEHEEEILISLAHALVHQWFGSLVTIKWWSQLWYKEGIAHFVALRAIENLVENASRGSPLEFMHEYAFNQLMLIYTTDVSPFSKPFNYKLQKLEELNREQTKISYTKPGFFFRMLSHALTDEIFKKGLSNAMLARAFSLIVPGDLWKYTSIAMKNSTKDLLDFDLSTAMQPWIKLDGFPIVTVSLDCNSKTVSFSQKKYVETSDKEDESCWWIPLNYVTAKDKNTKDTKAKLWLTCPKNTVKITHECTDWIVLNLNGTGLYKISYDEKNWDLLIKTLTEGNHADIPEFNRALLIAEAFDSANRGQMDYQKTLHLLSYLEKDKDYLPWKSAMKYIKFLRTMMIRRSFKYGHCQKFIGHLLTKIYQEQSVKLFQYTGRFKMLIMDAACTFNVLNCQKNAVKKYEKWMTTNLNTIPVHERALTYCFAIQNGGTREWNFLWEKYVSSFDPDNEISDVERTRILSSLGCTRQVWLINKFLDWAITDNSRIKKEDVPNVFFSIIDNDIGFYVLKEFLQAHEILIKRRYLVKIESMVTLATAWASRVTNYLEEKELMAFLNQKQDDFIDAPGKMDEIKKIIKFNLQCQQYLSTVEVFLTGYVEKYDL